MKMASNLSWVVLVFVQVVATQIADSRICFSVAGSTAGAAVEGEGEATTTARSQSSTASCSSVGSTTRPPKILSNNTSSSGARSLMLSS